jgi:Helix-hairpin-helix domain
MVMSTPVNKVSGIGPKTTEYLKRKRITTAEALVKSGTDILVLAPGFSPGRAETVIKEAINLLSGPPSATRAKTTNRVKVKAEKTGKKDKKKKDKKSKNKKSKKDKKKDKKKKNKKNKK